MSKLFKGQVINIYVYAYCLSAHRKNKLPRSRTNSTENLLHPPKPVSSVERAKPSYRLSSSRCSSRGSSRGSSRRSSVELMSEEENWYNGRSSGVKSGGQKNRRVWGSNPHTAGTAVTPADTKQRSAKKLHGRYYNLYNGDFSFL